MWTDNQVKALKPGKAKYRRSENTNQRGVGRLVVEVHPNGLKHFFFQYFRESNRVLVSIGRYRHSASTSGLSLSKAREQSAHFGSLLQNGVDIEHYLEEQASQKKEKQKQLIAKKRQGTFDQLMDSYIANMIADGKRSHDSVKRSLKIYVKTPFQDLIRQKASEIEADDIRMILSRMIDNGVTTHTNRVRSYLHAAFQHGLKQDNNPKSYLQDGIRFNLKYNPVAFVPKQTEYEKVGEHVITEKEIKIIWDKFNPPPVFEYLVKLSLTTGQRLGELVRLHRNDVNVKEKILTIPSSVSKNGKDHIVPLNDLSLSIVKSALKEYKGCEYLFPAKRGRKVAEDAHTSSATTANKIAEYCEDNKRVSKFVPRDIRRTVKTLMGKGGISKEIRDRIQNHSLQDVSTKHYDRYDYLKEKEHGMKVWNDYLNLIIKPQKNVVTLNKKRA